jgi:hypothetical protein
MTRSWAPFSTLLMCLAASLAVSCGSGGGGDRQLQSITISGVSNGGQVSYTATGTYSAPPTTVTPLPTSWYIQDPSGGYSLTTQPFEVSCGWNGLTVTAMAPVDPNAPSSGSVSSTKLIVANSKIICP